MDGLKVLYGDDVNVTQISDRINAVSDFQNVIDRSDAIAVVAPPALQKDFKDAAGDKPVLIARTERILQTSPDGTESKTVFAFRSWDELKAMNIEKHDFVEAKGNSGTVNMLWFSRHPLSSQQMEKIEQNYPNAKVEVTQVDRTISSASEIAGDIAKADVVGMVGPIDLQKDFLKVCGDDKPLITAKMDRVDDGDGKSHMEFDKWEQVDKIDVEREPVVTMEDVEKYREDGTDKVDKPEGAQENSDVTNSESQDTETNEGDSATTSEEENTENVTTSESEDTEAKEEDSVSSSEEDNVDSVDNSEKFENDSSDTDEVSSNDGENQDDVVEIPLDDVVDVDGNPIDPDNLEIPSDEDIDARAENTIDVLEQEENDGFHEDDFAEDFESASENYDEDSIDAEEIEDSIEFDEDSSDLGDDDIEVTINDNEFEDDFDAVEKDDFYDDFDDDGFDIQDSDDIDVESDNVDYDEDDYNDIDQDEKDW